MLSNLIINLNPYPDLEIRKISNPSFNMIYFEPQSTFEENLNHFFTQTILIYIPNSLLP